MPKITQSKQHKRANHILNGNPGKTVLVNGILTKQILNYVNIRRSKMTTIKREDGAVPIQ